MDNSTYDMEDMFDYYLAEEIKTLAKAIANPLQNKLVIMGAAQQHLRLLKAILNMHPMDKVDRSEILSMACGEYEADIKADIGEKQQILERTQHEKLDT